MDGIWLSGSSNWVRQGCYLVVRESQLGVTSMGFTECAYSYKVVAAEVNTLLAGH